MKGPGTTPRRTPTVAALVIFCAVVWALIAVCGYALPAIWAVASLSIPVGV